MTNNTINDIQIADKIEYDFNKSRDEMKDKRDALLDNIAQNIFQQVSLLFSEDYLYVLFQVMKLRADFWGYTSEEVRGLDKELQALLEKFYEVYDF